MELAAQERVVWFPAYW